jgi:transcriptional regulator with XRE-family HTH domain
MKNIFGDRVKSARQKAKLSQSDLASAMGLTQSQISKIEKGESDTSQENVKKLATILNVAVSYLMGETDEPASLDITSNVRKGSAQYFDEWVEIPVLDPTIIACAGLGNGGMTGIYASAEKTILLPANMVGIISVDADKHPFAVFVEGDSMEGARIPTTFFSNHSSATFSKTLLFSSSMKS